MEVSTVLMGLLDGSASSASLSAGNIKKVVVEALGDLGGRGSLGAGGAASGGAECVAEKSYASVARSSGSEVRVSHGPTVKLCNTTSFLVMPEEGKKDKFISSQVTKDTLCKVLKPADCGLRIKRLTYARDNSVKIEAQSPDIEKIKAHPGLAGAGLRICESRKINPRLIMHGVPTEMNAEEIKEEIIAQNLSGDTSGNIKVIYIFKPKQNKRTTSCILEVSPAARKAFFKGGRIYLRYSACSFADHIRIVQCFRCLSFGHFAANCGGEPSCGHCAGRHEMRDCKNRDRQPKCQNCERHQGSQGDLAHSAVDAVRCPLLCRKIKDKIADINYD